MNKRILALDFGTQMGFAIYASKVVTSGTIGFHRKKGRKTIPDDHLGHSYNMFKEWLLDVILDTCPEIIAFEEVRRFKGNLAAKAFGAWRGIMLQQAASRDIEVMPFEVGTIKKHATGNGRASKELMIAAAKKYFPDQDIEDDNQADALHILRLCMHTLENK